LRVAVFVNEEPFQDKTLVDVLRWQFGSNRKRATWPSWVENKAQPNLSLPYGKLGLRVTWINHSTFLIQSAELNILSDPIFSKRASPVFFAGPKRVRNPGLSFAELPRIDLVLVSHNHYDHMDSWTLRELVLKHDPVFVVPLGNGTMLKNMGSQKVIELGWWQGTNHKGLSVVLTPARHWSSRTPWDRFQSLWGAFSLKFATSHVYFAGDSGFGKHFHTYKEKLGAPDLAFIPIGAYEPRDFMKDSHMNPQDAVQAAHDLGAEHSIAMHWGTFQLTDEALDDPPKDLAAALKSNPIDFRVLEVGETQCF
jgi:L-ascorbate metabolism protein UlaG (beta-lactamase superfamily)